MLKQRTLKNTAHISGIGLHTGKPVDLILHPAAENTGILFRRVDLQPFVIVPATTAHVHDTHLNTSLTHNGASIATIEHLLSALAGLSIDNVLIDINHCEPPAMDGSALPFAEKIQAAGILEQNATKQFIRIKKKITVTEGDKFANLAPFEGCKISMTIHFNHPVIIQTQQSFSIDFSHTSYTDEISSARTFGFLSEYEYLRKNNLGLGAGLDNTLVLSDTELLNAEGLRDNAEFVKHKILDAMGDLRLLGHNFIGEFTGYQSGHTLNHKLRLALLDDPTAWEIVSG